MSKQLDNLMIAFKGDTQAVHEYIDLQVANGGYSDEVAENLLLELSKYEETNEEMGDVKDEDEDSLWEDDPSDSD